MAVAVTVRTNDPSEPGRIGLTDGPETEWWDSLADMRQELRDGWASLPKRLRKLIRVRERLLADGLNSQTATAAQIKTSIERAGLDI